MIDKMNDLRVAVSFTESQRQIQAESLASKLTLPLISAAEFSAYDFVLVYTEQCLQLQACQDKLGKPFSIDFLQGRLAYRAQHGGGIKQALAKAVGMKSGVRPQIIDATAGLGRDAFILANLGCEVLMLERNPIVFSLLQDALLRAKEYADFNLKLSLQRVDAVTYLSQQTETDVVYLDPMFPERKKSALVKKEMQILHKIVGQQLDEQQLLKTALAIASKRIVVKRPNWALPIAGQQPSFVIKNQHYRFDCYS